MIPRIAKNGASFRGAGKYYLHDKDDAAPKELKPRTDDRVAWTDTRNLAHDDPERALDEMWATAERQDALKRAAGVRLSGRKTTCPVKTISLAWHPSETVGPEEMARAADSYLMWMGYSEHQAVFVGHRDTAHPHMHIILNRVHPETGRTLDDKNERTRSQAWALEYEKERGHIWCERRLEAENDNARPNLNVPHNVVAMTRDLEQQFMSGEARRAEEVRLEWQMLKDAQKQERIDFFAEGRTLFKELRHKVYAEVRAEFKPVWRAHHAARIELEKEAAAHSDNAISRALFLLRQGDTGRAAESFGDRDSVARHVWEAVADERAGLHAGQRQATRERQEAACAELMHERTAEYALLKDRQRDERAELKEQQASGQPATWLWQRGDVDGPSEKGDERQMRIPASSSPAAIEVKEVALPSLSAAREVTDREPAVAAEPGDDRHGRRVPADLVSGAMGAAANYLADELGELFAPTPPEVREAKVKSEAAREEARAAAAPDQSAYARQVEAAVRRAEEVAAANKEREWWDERDKARERDR